VDLLKQLSRSALLVVAGLVVVVLSLSASFEFGPLKYSSDAPFPSRIALFCVGLVLVSVGLVSEYLAFRRRSKASHSSANVPAPRVDTLFRTLDELPGFNVFIRDSTRVSILGRTAVNLLTSYERSLQEVCASGTEVRIVFVDPRSDAAKHLYGSQADTYAQNLEAATKQLARLTASIGSRLAVRTTTDVPPFSLILIEGHQKPRMIRVQLNFMHSRIGRDRPVFVVEEGDAWFDAFQEEFEATWRTAGAFDVV